MSNVKLNKSTTFDISISLGYMNKFLSPELDSRLPLDFVKFITSFKRFFNNDFLGV